MTEAEREREAVVRYLKRAALDAPDAFSMFASGNGCLLESPGGALSRIADAIKRGDHLQGK